jgi:hypothetical protein
MRVSPKFTKAGLAGLAVAGATLAGFVLPGTAVAATTATATTTFSAYPVVGNHGTWASADFNRVVTLEYLNPVVPTSTCGTDATACVQYEVTIKDTGTFSAIAGDKSPQAGVTVTGTPSGPFMGTTVEQTFYSSGTANAALVPTTVTGAGKVSLADWAEQFFPAGTLFGNGPVVTSTSYAYSAPATCENWVESNTNSSGSMPADGDITGINHCVSVTGPISTFVNHSASCVDNSNYNWTDGNPLQIWTCGVAGGADQNFRLNTYNGSEVLEAVAGAQVSDAPWCVTAPDGEGRLTISACTGTGTQIISKQGPYYVFTATTDVMDLRAFVTKDGNAINTWVKNGGKNQQWSLP